MGNHALHKSINGQWIYQCEGPFAYLMQIAEGMEGEWMIRTPSDELAARLTTAPIKGWRMSWPSTDFISGAVGKLRVEPTGEDEEFVTGYSIPDAAQRVVEAKLAYVNKAALFTAAPAEKSALLEAIDELAEALG